MTGLNDSEKAVELFMELMILERVDPNLISTVVDKVMKRVQSGKV